jgi:hypothetical protein
MELLEGNYSQNYKGDSFWGNSIYITVFRNHFSALRAAAPPLNSYTYEGYPYMDLYGRTAVDVLYRSDYHSLIGNVLGQQGQSLLSYPGINTQTTWVYEALAGFPADPEVVMWSIGAHQYDGGWDWYATTHETIQRDGNWDWYTQSQRWHGVGGAAGAGTPTTLPDSFYLAAKPAFFGANPWPWVNPTTGTVTTLPAKARFEAMPGH